MFFIYLRINIVPTYALCGGGGGDDGGGGGGVHPACKVCNATEGQVANTVGFNIRTIYAIQ